MSALKELKGIPKGIESLRSRMKSLSIIKEIKDGKMNKAGTPPSEMNPLTDDEWWGTCRDETAPGEEHGCFDCYTMCASHPEVIGAGGIAQCISKGFTLCVIPEIQDSFQRLLYFLNPPDTCFFENNQVDPDTWSSQTCDGAVSCSNECVRFCETEGFRSGSCTISQDTFLCNCT